MLAISKDDENEKKVLPLSMWSSREGSDVVLHNYVLSWSLVKGDFCDFVTIFIVNIYRNHYYG